MFYEKEVKKWERRKSFAIWINFITQPILKKTPPFQKFLVNSFLNTDSVLQSHSCLVGGQLKQLGTGQCGEIVQSDISERCGAFTHPMWSIASPIRYSGERHATANWIKSFVNIRCLNASLLVWPTKKSKQQ